MIHRRLLNRLRRGATAPAEDILHSLPVFLRLTGRPVILVGEGPTADAKRRILEEAGARIVEEGSKAQLAVVVDDEAAVSRLKVRGVLVNAVDRPDLCDFTLPAIVDRDPVIVAVGTGGASAGLAKAVRQRIEALLPTTLGPLADGLNAAKSAIRDRFPDPTDRRLALDVALARGGPLDPLGGGEGDVAAWLGTAATPTYARLEVVTITSPDPDDLTLRTARIIERADRIYHDAICPPAILKRARADAERIMRDPPAPLPPGLSVQVITA